VNNGLGIAYCDGRRLKKLFLSGSERVIAHRSELDRINVFPIPDGDTGTNLAQTFRAMVDAVEVGIEASVAGVASRLAEAGVLGARGNSGMMMSHFFLGFADGLAGRSRAGPEDFAVALRRASDSLYQAIDQPVEGTILTVVRESTEEVERLAGETGDLGVLASKALAAAQLSLERTPKLLAVLREAKVVDAGAKGYVRFLEGVVGLVGGRPLARPSGLEVRNAAVAADFPDDPDRSHRYCTEYVVRGSPLPEQSALAGAVRGLGSSLIVTRAATLAKIHIHTDEPARVEEALRSVGGAVECVKAEDMLVQHRNLQRARKRRVAVVTDTTCDLPSELVIERNITVVPLTVMFGDEAFLDQVEITYDEFLRRLTAPGQPHPTTSQPTPAHFKRAFERAAEDADEVLGLFVGGALSGTHGQAQAAATRFEGARIRVFDSRSSSLGLGLQALRAAELADEGLGLDEIMAELERIQGRSGLLLTVDTLEYLKRSGRLGKARAFVGGLLDLKPILSLDEDGVVVPVDKVRGREALMPRVLQVLRQRVPSERARLHMGVVHVDCRDVAHDLAAAVKQEFQPDEVLVRPAAAALSAHTGPGAWAVFYQAE
jgi:DegV family protein with EDD domain